MTIDLERARDLVRQTVEERGRDFVYKPETEGFGLGCYYEPKPEMFGADDPRATSGCLVGEALKLAGETRHLDFCGAVDVMADEYPDMLTSAATEYLMVAQNRQDESGVAWGAAFDAAEEALGTGEI